MAPANTSERPEWHSRGYLPHWEAGETAQAITFRLADSLPAALLEAWRYDLQTLPEDVAQVERRKRIEATLDRGHGVGELVRPEIGAVVEETLLLFDSRRYRLHAWVIMPNHAHVLITPLQTQSLSAITHSWKSFTAMRANSLLSRKGRFWAPEYFDRAIRDENHFANASAYIAMNPVKAGLCKRPEDWRFSSSWERRSPI
jgi:REP element-mobilizing transposase RayT